jgi:hypothetical protein
VPRVHTGVSVVDAWPTRPIVAEHASDVHLRRSAGYLLCFPSLSVYWRTRRGARVTRRQRQGGGPHGAGRAQGRIWGGRDNSAAVSVERIVFLKQSDGRNGMRRGFWGGGWCADDREPRLAAPAVPAARASAHSQNQGTRPLGQCRAGQEMEIRTDCEQQMLGMGSAKARPAAAVGRQRERALGEGGGRGIANNSCIGVGTEATGQDLGRSRSFGDVDGWEMEETERESERGSRGGETQKAKAGWVERHAGPGTRCLPTLSKCTSRWPPPHISRRQQV